ncbi:MAG: ABC transporter substrate-binding protein [Kiritimatiellae bacterium]|nr:ABC transporter substrate-binding protein [Kiritimatiellia bacterium]
MKKLPFLLVLAALLAGPFVFRREPDYGAWKKGDPVLVVITPHNEAIRGEMASAFSAWHQTRYGVPVKIDWRAIGGTSEIARYLQSEFLSSVRAYWLSRGGAWPADAASLLFSPAPPERTGGMDDAAWANRKALWEAYRTTDDPAAFTTKLDLFFGGGTYDAENTARQGMAVPAWPAGEEPAGVLLDADGRERFPAEKSGEKWRGEWFYGTTLSTFGICWNRDRLRERGIDRPPARWRDLADPRYFASLGLADPTKSGSLAKAFETIVHVEIARAVEEAGFPREVVGRIEAAGGADAPEGYEEAVERGWRNGLTLLKRLGANARYFTDSAGKVPLDVAKGDASAGLCIDFYGRFQADVAGEDVMGFATPAGESGVSADPITLLRGAPHKELAKHFIEFVVSDAGQKIWCYRPGTEGGPKRLALRRLPIARGFYEAPEGETHKPSTSADLTDPALDAYALADAFTYHARWTGRMFSVLRDVVKAMCLDSGKELKEAAKAIADAGGEDAVPEAAAAFRALPDDLAERGTALAAYKAKPREDILREWTDFFRAHYREAARLARAASKK